MCSDTGGALRASTFGSAVANSRTAPRTPNRSRYSSLIRHRRETDPVHDCDQRVCLAVLPTAHRADGAMTAEMAWDGFTRPSTSGQVGRLPWLDPGGVAALVSPSPSSTASLHRGRRTERTSRTRRPVLWLPALDRLANVLHAKPRSRVEQRRATFSFRRS